MNDSFKKGPQSELILDADVPAHAGALAVKEGDPHGYQQELRALTQYLLSLPPEERLPAINRMAKQREIPPDELQRRRSQFPVPSANPHGAYDGIK